MATIHIARNGQPLGVFSEDQMREEIRNGRIIATDLAWSEGMADWRPLGEMAAQWNLEMPLPPPVPSPNPGFSESVTSQMYDGNEPAWERREEIGFFSAIFQTIRGVLISPRTTFANMRQTGGFAAPFFYSWMIALITQIVGIPYALSSSDANPVLLGLHKYFPGSMFNLTTIAGPILLSPLLCAVSLFAFGGFIHLSLMLVGGAKTPFETTFRINAYANGSIAACYLLINAGTSLSSLWISPTHVSNFVALPALGLFIWLLICIVIGLQQCNRIEGWRAVIAAVLPLFFCCCLVFVLAVIATVTFAEHLPGIHYP
jgi:hypothetical protein